MSYVIAAPEFVSATATRLAGIGAAIGEANAAAAAPTTAVLAAGADEISAAVAALYSGHAEAYHALGPQAAAFHARFVAALDSGAVAYAAAESANAAPLTLEQQLLNAINAPTQVLLGRPLIGNGADGTTPGQPGGAGGILYGNGGNGAPG